MCFKSNQFAQKFKLLANLITYHLVPGESLPPCRGLWGTLHTGDDIE